MFFRGLSASVSVHFLYEGFNSHLSVNLKFLILNIEYLVLIICSTSPKWFQISQSNINSFIYTKLNGFKHRKVILSIEFRCTVKKFQAVLINTNNSIQHCSFVSTQLNGSNFFNIYKMREFL